MSLLFGDKAPAPWESALLKGNEGKVKCLTHNVIHVLVNAPEWRKAIAWDEFAERIVIVKQCPAGAPGPWTDLSDTRTSAWLQQSKWKLETGSAMVAESVNAVAHQNSVHPLRDRLIWLTWDGVDRIDTWTTRYLGAEDTEVHREIGKRWLLAAVSRAFEPGSQVDTALILEGEQGRGKSSAVRILSLGFFTDEIADLGSKDAAMQLHGAWIVELPELDALGRAETSRIKAFLTRRSDRYRSPYGRRVEEHPRQCVFAGTVNHNDWLKDETGGRRFLPIECGSIDKAALQADCNQLWAEAVTRFQKGEEVWTSNERLRDLITSHTSIRYVGDSWHERIQSFAELNSSVSVPECLERLGIDVGKWSQQDQTRVAKILKSIGFTRRHITWGRKRQWRYVAPNGSHVGSIPKSQNQEARSSDPPCTSINVNNTHIEGPIDLMGKGGATGFSGSPDQPTDEGGCFDDLLRDAEGDAET